MPRTTRTTRAMSRREQQPKGKIAPVIPPLTTEATDRPIEPTHRTRSMTRRLTNQGAAVVPPPAIETTDRPTEGRDQLMEGKDRTVEANDRPTPQLESEHLVPFAPFHIPPSHITKIECDHTLSSHIPLNSDGGYVMNAPSPTEYNAAVSIYESDNASITSPLATEATDRPVEAKDQPTEAIGRSIAQSACISPREIEATDRPIEASEQPKEPRMFLGAEEYAKLMSPEDWKEVCSEGYNTWMINTYLDTPSSTHRDLPPGCPRPPVLTPTPRSEWERYLPIRYEKLLEAGAAVQAALWRRLESGEHLSVKERSRIFASPDFANVLVDHRRKMELHRRRVAQAASAQVVPPRAIHATNRPMVASVRPMENPYQPMEGRDQPMAQSAPVVHPRAMQTMNRPMVASVRPVENPYQPMEGRDQPMAQIHRPVFNPQPVESRQPVVARQTPVARHDPPTVRPPMPAPAPPQPKMFEVGPHDPFFVREDVNGQSVFRPATWHERDHAPPHLRALQQAHYRREHAEQQERLRQMREREELMQLQHEREAAALQQTRKRRAEDLSVAEERKRRDLQKEAILQKWHEMNGGSDERADQMSRDGEEERRMEEQPWSTTEPQQGEPKLSRKKAQKRKGADNHEMHDHIKAILQREAPRPVDEPSRAKRAERDATALEARRTLAYDHEGYAQANRRDPVDPRVKRSRREEPVMAQVRLVPPTRAPFVRVQPSMEMQGWRRNDQVAPNHPSTSTQFVPRVGQSGMAALEPVHLVPFAPSHIPPSHTWEREYYHTSSSHNPLNSYGEYAMRTPPTEYNAAMGNYESDPEPGRFVPFVPVHSAPSPGRVGIGRVENELATSSSRIPRNSDGLSRNYLSEVDYLLNEDSQVFLTPTPSDSDSDC